MATNRKAPLLPSDELHFLRRFWKYSPSFVHQDGTIDHHAAILDYENENGRAAPGDYHRMFG